MKKVLLSLLAVVLILGALGAVGFAGYRYGYNQGALATSNGDTQPLNREYGFVGPRGMPMHDFGFNRSFGPGGFGMMQRGVGFGFFSPLIFLARIAFWGLIIWAIYMLATRSGWRLVRNPPVNTETENKQQE